MKQTEQLMLASIRACAQTVDELVITMAALPAKVARQLIEMRESLTTALREQAEATTLAVATAEALRADMGDLAAGLRARLDAAEQAHSETRQIIADNHGHVRESTQSAVAGLDAIRADLTKGILDIGGAIHTVRTDLEKAGETLAQRVVSQGEELFALNALVPEVKAELKGELDVALKQIQDSFVSLDALEVSINSRVDFKQFEDLDTDVRRIDGAVSDNHKAIVEVNGRVDETAANTAKQIAGVAQMAREALEVTADELKGELEAKTTPLAETVRNLLDSTNDEYTKTVNRIEKLETEFDTRTKTLTESITLASNSFEELRHLRDADVEVVGDLEASLKVTSETLLARLDGTDASVTAVRESVVEMGTAVGKDIADSRTTLHNQLSAVIGEVNKSVGLYFENATGQIVTVGEEIANVGKEVVAVIERVDSTNSRIDGVADGASETRGLVDSLVDGVATANENLTTVSKTLDSKLEGLLIIVDQNDALVRELVTDVDKKTNAVIKEVTTHNEAVYVRLAETETKLRSDMDQALIDDKAQLKIELQALASVALDKATAAQLDLNSYMEGIDTRFAELTVRTNTNVADWTGAFHELKTGVATEMDTRIEKLLKGLDEVPVGVSPEDMAELQVRNAALVDAQIGTALANMRVETEYSDGVIKLVAVLPRHDGTESRSVVEIPADIGVRYREVWLASESYKPGDMVTHKGSTWIAKSNSAGEPGNDITGWTLAVKRGNNGKDGNSVKVYETHNDGAVYREGDFLRWGNRLWQAKKEVRKAPDLSEVASTETWSLIGSLQ